MKIEKIRSTVVAARMPTPWKIGNYVLEKGYALIVEVETDEGLTGVGEALVRLAPGASRAIVDELLGPALIGADPLEIEGLWTRMFHLMRFRGHTRGFFMEALSGLDTALWDIAGKALGVPVWKLLLGCGRREFPVYASSIFWDEPAVMAREAEGLAGRGFRAMKVKIGQGVERDAQCIGAIREAVGSAVDIMVDANGAYGRSDALRLGRHLDRLGVRWFEEPVPADDLDGYALLAARLDVPVAAGEAEFEAFGVRGLLEHGVRVIQPDVARAGGITGCRRIAALAEAYHIPYAPHTGASSAVCMAASLHLAAAIPNFLIYEHMVGDNPLARVLLKEPLPEPRAGMMAPPAGPGLGIELDQEAMEMHSEG